MSSTKTWKTTPKSKVKAGGRRLARRRFPQPAKLVDRRTPASALQAVPRSRGCCGSHTIKRLRQRYLYRAPRTLHGGLATPWFCWWPSELWRSSHSSVYDRVCGGVRLVSLTVNWSIVGLALGAVRQKLIPRGRQGGFTSRSRFLATKRGHFKRGKEGDILKEL